MNPKTIKLPDNLIAFLISLPETGMGYQDVKVFLKGGGILHGHKVLNAELLVLEGNEIIFATDIEKIELENNS